jgi:hypothetical protein
VNQLKGANGPSPNSLPPGLGLVTSLLAEQTFQPLQPRTLEEAGLTDNLVDKSWSGPSIA